jgi:hypothetical protein
MSFVVKTFANVELTITGSGIGPTDLLELYYLVPGSSPAEYTAIDNSSFTAQEYQSQKTFSLPYESISNVVGGQGNATLLLKNLSSGECLNTFSTPATVEGLLIEESGEGGDNDITCNLYSNFALGSTGGNACTNASNSTFTNLYVDTFPGMNLFDFPDVVNIFTNSECSIGSKLTAQFISDGQVHRYYDGVNSLSAAEVLNC